MKQTVSLAKKPEQQPFVKRMATIVFETNVRQKGRAKARIDVADFALSATDQGTYAKLSESFLHDGTSVVSKSRQDIASIMPLEVFMDALPRLARVRALTVTFWEHAAATPNHWHRVKSF